MTQPSWISTGATGLQLLGSTPYAYGAQGNGTANDTAPLQNAINAFAGTSVPLYVTAGTYKVTAPLTIPSNVLIKMGPSTTINDTIAYVDSFVDCLLTTTPNPAPATTLAAQAVEGANVVQVVSTSTFVPGGRFEITEAAGDNGLSYLIVGIGVIGSTNVTAGGLYGGGGTLNGTQLTLNVNGAGATTLNLSGVGNAASASALQTAIAAQWPALQIVQVGGPVGVNSGTGLVLTAATSVAVGGGSANGALGLTNGMAMNALQTDWTVALAFSSGDTVAVITNCIQNVDIDFGGATLSGTGGRAFHSYAAWNVTLRNATFNASWNAVGPDYDIGNRNVRFENITVNFVATCQIGLNIESGQAGTIDRCHIRGPFNQGIEVNGIGHEVSDCTTDGCNIGIMLSSALAPGDIWCARHCVVRGGTTMHSTTGGNGLNISANSYGNTVIGHTASYNSVGFALQTGNAVAFTCGTSRNQLIGCTARGNTNRGIFIGDGVAAAVGNTVSGCVLANNFNGIHVAALADQTTIDSTTIDSSTNSALIIGANSTRTKISNCSFTNNAAGGVLGVNPAGDCTFINCSSYNDGAGGGAAFYIQGSPIVIIESQKIEQISATNDFGIELDAAFGGVLIVGNGSRIIATGAGVGNGTGIYAQGTGSVDISHTTISGKATGLNCHAGTVNIGPGVSLDGCTTPLTLGAATVTMAQTGGTAAVAGTATLTFAQHYNTAIELAAAAGASTITTYAIPGLTFVARNLSANALTVKTTTAATVVVAAGKSAVVAVKANGDMVRVSPDT